MFHTAADYLRLGYGVVPLRENEKRPAIDWKPFQSRKATMGELAVWFGHGTRHGLAIVTGTASGDLCVVDFDDLAKADAFRVRFRDRITTVVETPRPGLHFYFRKNGLRNSQGEKVDGRAEGGIVVAPPTSIDGKSYRFADGFGLVSPAELRELPEDAIPARPKPAGPVQAPGIRNVRAYIKTIVAVSGSGGHSATFRVACKLRDAGFTEAEALAELVTWNSTNCDPPWTVQELLHKCRDAFAKATK